MNKKDLQTKRNNTRRLFRHSSGIHVGCIRINTNNSYEHELKKFKICWALKKAKEEFISEGVFEDGLRGDVISLDQGVIFEIICSEKEESLLEKAETYPLPIIKVFTKKPS